MALHAIDALSDALTATRRYQPHGAFEWLWLVVVAVLVGSPALGLPTGGGAGTGTSGGLSPEERAQLDGMLLDLGEIAELLVAVAIVLLALWLLFALLAAFLEFPFLHWLKTGDTAIRAEAGAHWRQALGLAAFRIVLGSLGFLALGALVVSQVGTDATPTGYLLAAGDVAGLAALVALPTGLVGAFTTAFVVPTMVIEGTGIVGGWRRFWGTLTDAPKQFAAYAVAVAIIAYVGGILIVLVALFALLPGLVFGGIFGLLAAIASPGLGFTVGAAVAGLAAIVAFLAAQAIFQVFVRYYALFVLGGVDSSLDFIPERRQAVRSGDGGDGGGEPDKTREEPGAGPDDSWGAP